MRLIVTSLLFGLSGALTPALAADALELQPLTIDYQVSRGGKVLGSARRHLEPADGDTWRLTMSSELEAFLVRDKRDESSLFRWRNQAPQPLEYRYLTESSFKGERLIEQHFDWQRKMETGKRTDKDRTWELPLPDNAVDRLSASLAIRQALTAGRESGTLQVSYRGRVREFHFQKLGQETLTTPAGSFETDKVSFRESGDEDITYYWFARGARNLLLQISDSDEGDGFLISAARVDPAL